jgi:hypothetical protein
LVTGRSTGFDNLLFLVIPPADRPQPAQLATLEWAAVVNEYGLFAKVLDPGDYWIVPLNLVLLSPNESIRVQKANGEQQVGVIRVHVSAGAATRADIVVTVGSYDNPPTPVAVTAPSELQVTPPRDGSAAGSQPGLRPPVTGTAGLKPLR